ncbi:Ig-like domain-containing protein [Paenibacillus sp. YN15]|uniref:Ig-like domain-containing protein n=1 Tax=Paenibacillus sp. YN15 TaxID=1742774 RepID=UPI0015EB53FE|nr:Ig-like domain-containing protein [Paenibacillus sp. YN15]
MAEPAVRPDYNLLTNSGFETDLKGWNAGSTAALVRSTSYSGNIRQLGVSFEPGQAYYFSAWVKRVSGSGAVAIYITQTGNKWNNSTYPIMAEAVVGTNWTHIEGIKTFPTEPSPAPSGYVYDNADVYIQHKVDDKETKDPAGHYVDFYVDDIIAEPVLPSTIAISGSASAAIPPAGSQTYFYTKTVKNQMGNTTGITDSAITWSVDGNPEGVSIDRTTGALTVTDTAEAGIIAVRAVSDVNPSAAAAYPVELTPSTPDPEPKAPVAANVRVDGSAKPGRVLTGLYDYTDANGDKEAGSSYNWLIGDTPTGAFAAIPEALGRTYTVSEDDLNKYVQFQVTPKNGADPAVGDSKSSQPVPVMANAAPTAENVCISGVQFVGRQLSAAYTYKDADGDPEAGSVYRWLQSDSPDGTYSPIDGAVQAVLELSAGLEGKYIQFEVTPSDAYSRGGAYLSQPTEKIAAVASSVYYVDPVNGDDTNSGTNENEAFKTIQKARDIVRMSSSDMTHDITVVLKGGRYEQGCTLIDEPLYDQFGKIYATRQIKSGTLTFDERDSGTNGFNVIYQAAPGEAPVISGGRSITGWELHDAEKNIYKASSGGNLDTRQLYVNGVRAVRARSEGGLTNAVQTAAGYTTSDTFLADWRKVSDLEMVFKVEWTNPRAKVQSISVADGVAHITMQQPGYSFAANKGGTSIKTPWYYENAYELLDQPGEWYLDSSEGYFYYKPRSGENMATADAVAPELEQLLTIQGSTLDTPVHHMKFSGITFEYNTWLRPSTNSGLSDAQNSHIRETGSGFGDRLGLAAVTLQNAKAVVFEGNTFSHLGSIALKTLEGSQDNLIIGNTFTDISGNAIAIGEPSFDQQHTTDIRKLNRNNNVLNNYIRDIGVEYRSSAAISAGYPMDMEISHNEIGHVPYSGLHVGYGWATSPDSNLRNVSIRNNLIYDSMEQLHDGGAIYTLGTTGGSPEETSRVSGNYLLRMHNEFGALYFDEGSNYWNATDNVVETAPTYLHIWKDTIEDVHVNNTYTSTNLFRNDGTHTRVSNTQWFQDAVWPSEALDIIKQAGLEAPYRHLRPSEPVERLFIQDLPLQSGQSAEIQVAAALTHNGASVDLSLSDIKFTSDNPEVVTIDGSGTATAVGPGKASLRATVNGQPVIVANAIYVDDHYDKLTVSASKPILMPGQSIHLDVLGVSKYGKLYSKGPLTFASANPQAATVSDTGKVTATGIGSAEIVVTAQSNGMPMSGSVTITVANAQADDIIKDIDYWYLSGTSKAIPGDGSLTVSTPSGDAIFQGKRYEDELLKVNMQIDDPTGGWHAITFRNLKEDQSYSSSVNEDYMITMTPEAVELHRFNKSVRTVVYGTFNGTDGIMGPPIPNEYFSFGERHTVEFGALNVADGVRIILNVDGHSVIDTVDSLNGHLTTPGFMGLYSRTGTITLSYPEPDNPDNPTVPAPAAPALQLGATESTRASLTWTAVDGATGYAIFKSTASGSYGLALDTVTGSTYSYTAQGLTNGVSYYFVVKAIGPGEQQRASAGERQTPGCGNTDEWQERRQNGNHGNP